MERLTEFVSALAGFATLAALFHVTWATLLGIFVGSLPGLTATMGVALLTTLTYTLDRDTAILVLICMYVGAIYGGSRTAILLNIPGTPASAATALDGYPLAQRGEAAYAMALATAGSALGTVVGIVLLVLLAPPLGEAALKFGSFEFFWLAVFGIVISGQLTGGAAPIKGYIAGILGLMVAMVGSDGIHAHVRFNFGLSELNGGIGLIPAMVGAFGFAEVLTVMWRRRPDIADLRRGADRVLPRLADLWRYRWTIGRSGVIGTMVGIIPGVGEDIGAWASYAAARRLSPERDQFGYGSKEGLTAAETGNSAVVPGALIPALTLAVPGSAPAAVLIAALFIHGIRPGPMIMLEQPDFIYSVAAMLFLATIAIAVYGLALARVFVQVLKVPREYLMPVVFALCVIGPFALTQRLFDVWVMVGFGVAGFVLRQMNFPMPPLVLGIILGDLLDKNLRRGLTLSDGDLTPFFTRPISAVFVALILLTILASLPAVRRALGRLLPAGRRADR
ncbi:MAG TPA: tripartite tricarboxylate transporter permease [Amaricoccus sp.]|uniref:tripartite tricarboxylate transporter permease n=3 Tax=Amaricoccus sp. TaxID=1872485 RepID=UPI002BE8A1EA|nr:tripartite tricarboxylate transporter permease [Amaricoccus sp.]HMR54460.1 tripartite tricarboxylate transporter permease [Amaricoccus sp.]HMR61457.1 tripartite tricarboxylate transporter permease [Amaricoccus sp.]HMU01490.1 tripartite tricarboxylate transporter permease [Amaricoccus sp.]